MASDFTFANVPAFYKEMYDILCPSQENVVDQDMFIKLLVKSSLPKQTLSQIWTMVDTSQGYLSRTGLYKALSLVAFAQQGKAITEKLFVNSSGDGLPKPSLGDLSDLRALSIRLRREKNPTRLGLTYQDISNTDTVQVSLIPEKKGLFLKHIEYEVLSLRNKSTVQRRYNDFLALQELLLLKFPYRMIPQLPPKKVMGANDSQFIEVRRKALKRFINLLARHPVISEDKILQFFLTFQGTDAHHKMKEHFRGVLDEFNTNELANEAEDLLPIDTANQFAIVKDQMKQVYNCISQLRNSAERMVERAKDDATDLILFGKELCALSSCCSTGSDWGTAGNETWHCLKDGVKGVYPVFTNVSNAFLDLASEEEEGIVEEMNLFLDLLSSYKDLCDRYENTFGQQRQRSTSRAVRKLGASQISIDAEIQAQQLQEKRNYFFLHCLHMETQLVYSYMEILANVLQSVVKMQSHGYSQVATIWEQALPLFQSLIPNNGAITPTSTISR